MRALIRRFDALVRQAIGVFEFCDDEDCLLRLQITRAPHLLSFPGQEVGAGESVLALHLWNEHLPALPEAGPDLAWARRTQRLFIRSLRAAAAQMRLDPRMASVRAVGGITVLFFPGDRSGGILFIQRLGFTVMPYHQPLGRFGEFWENFYTWWIMWTYNPVSLRHRQLFQLRRSEFWMPVEEFLNRYGLDETAINS
jgi:hypothetical protein